jgi:hypothetical protein
MNRHPNTKLYKECPECKSKAFGQYDVYCPRCGNELKDHEDWLAGISDYAKALLIDYLETYPGLARESDIRDIPDCACEEISANGNVMFDQGATRRYLAECWNEVEIALDDWRESNGPEYPVRNIEQLHIFSIARHAEMIWREIRSEISEYHLDAELIAYAVDRLKSR